MRKVELMRLRSGGEAAGGGVSWWKARNGVRSAAVKNKVSIGRTAAGRATWVCGGFCGSSGIRLHSFNGALFAGRSHCPVLLQQLFLAVGNMKNLGQEMQPPHRRVAIIRSDSHELTTVLITSSPVGYHAGARVLFK